MHLETIKASRKTPGDGKILVSEQTFDTLQSLNNGFVVRAKGIESTGTLRTLECSCNKFGADSAPHKHHFVHADVLHGLVADETVALVLRGSLLEVNSL